jgi:hypothetical protein
MRHDNRWAFVGRRELPSEAPGLKVAGAKEALLPHLPGDLFPEGNTAG